MSTKARRTALITGAGRNTGRAVAIGLARDGLDVIINGSMDLEAAVWLSQAFLPGMVERGWGRVVNFTGMNAIHGYAGRAPVSVAKHGLWGLTKALAKEFGPKGITVNAVSPGPIAADDDQPGVQTHRHGYVAKVPLGRMGTPGEVATVVRMLASEGGAYVNGQMIGVNGGAET